MGSKDTFFSRKLSLNCNGRLIDLTVPHIMGIVNVTPDSFYDGGRYTDEIAIMSRVEKVIAEGADFIDVGAYSSRPGATDISEELEIERLRMALKPVRKNYPKALISVDTFRSSVAAYVVKEFGVDMINDISAGLLDEAMIQTIAALKVPYVMMHMQGNPQTMQLKPKYNDVVKDLVDFFARRLDVTRDAGILDAIIDPGFGFGKTMDHNFRLLKNLRVFEILGVPVMVGMSRKSMVYKTLNLTPEEALNGTTVLNSFALAGGANILRVHDVKEAVEAVKLFSRFAMADSKED